MTKSPTLVTNEVESRSAVSYQVMSLDGTVQFCYPLFTCRSPDLETQGSRVETRLILMDSFCAKKSFRRAFNLRFPNVKILGLVEEPQA
jgi:hypothetical protein